MTRVIVRGESDKKEVRRALASQLFAPDEFAGKIHGELIGLRAANELIQRRADGMLLVELDHPAGERVAVILAGYKAALLLVEPVGAQAAVTGRKNGGPVFERYSVHARASQGRQTQLIG